MKQYKTFLTSTLLFLNFTTCLLQFNEQTKESETQSKFCLPLVCVYDIFNHISETTEKLVSNLLDDQKLGIWFYDVVDIIGINEEHRKACQQAWIMHEILLTFLLKNTYYFIGSSIEGTFAAGETSSEFI